MGEAVVVDVLTRAVVHTGRVELVLPLTVVVQSPRGAAWHFRRRDGRGVGAVDELALQGGAWR